MTQTIVITGASAGIGRATALRFMGAGWNVALLARRESLLSQMAEGHPDTLAIGCDVSDLQQLEAAFDQVVKRFGRVDVLFNNAGIFRPANLIDDMPIKDWSDTVDVNLNGMVYAARAAFGQMRRQQPQGGRIINNGSISAHAPRPGSLGYTVTKHAISGLTKVLALDGRPFDIACGQIDVGNAGTELAAALGQGAAQADGTVRPEPMMDVAQVADAVFNMASLPLSTNVLSMTIMATKMPFVGRG